jgi:hypothetical protein
MTKRSNVSREHMAALGRLGGLIGGKSRAAKYTSEQLQQIHANQLRTRFERMTAEQAREFQRKAAQGRWGMTADERSKLSRTLNERRWGKVAYAKNQEKADRLCAFLREYISAKRYAPSMREIPHAIHQDAKTIRRLLQILERIGRIQLHPWDRGITLTNGESEPPGIAFSFGVEPAAQSFASILAPRSTRKCSDCDEPAVAGKTRCRRHLARTSVASACSHKRTYAQKKLDAICVNCDEPAVKGRVQCERHLRLNRAASRSKRPKGASAFRRA